MNLGDYFRLEICGGGVCNIVDSLGVAIFSFVLKLVRIHLLGSTKSL